MKILLIGASSYVGARIFYDLQSKHEIIGTYNNNPLSKSFIQLDITDKNKVNKVFEDIKPSVIVHVANFPSPRNAVNNEENFTKLNDDGTKNVVEGANQIGAKVIFISSQAANVKTDIYGKLKAKSEETVAFTKAGYLILRPSLIIGFSPNTKNPRTFNKILGCIDNPSTKGDFDTSWKLQPTYLGHLSQLIDQTISSDSWNKSIPVFINTFTTQYQLAKDILTKFDLEVNPIDQHINILPSTDNLDELNAFSLLPNTYEEMINVIVREIIERDKFTIL